MLIRACSLLLVNTLGAISVTPEVCAILRFHHNSRIRRLVLRCGTHSHRYLYSSYFYPCADKWFILHLSYGQYSTHYISMSIILYKIPKLSTG